MTELEDKLYESMCRALDERDAALARAEGRPRPACLGIDGFLHEETCDVEYYLKNVETWMSAWHYAWHGYKTKEEAELFRNVHEGFWSVLHPLKDYLKKHPPTTCRCQNKGTRDV